MINRELIAPESIVIIGGSNNTQKPGGKIIRNLLEGKISREIICSKSERNRGTRYSLFSRHNIIAKHRTGDISRSGSQLPLYCRRAGFDPQYQSIYYYIGRIRRRNS